MTITANFKCLPLFVASIFSFFPCYGGIQERLSAIKIHEMTFFNEIGYSQCDSVGAGGLDRGELSIIQNLIRKNDTIFDAGANLGEWSCSVLRHVPSAVMHAFEPIPEVCHILKHKLSSYSNVHVHQLALFSSNGELEFTYYPDISNLSTIYERKSVTERLRLNPKFINVKTTRLDDFCRAYRIPHIDFLKIDTEGSELDILLGALGLLTDQSIDFIQFEYGGTYIDAKTTLKSVYDLLSSSNYSLYKISHFGLIEVSEWDERLENFEYANFLAVKKDL